MTTLHDMDEQSSHRVARARRGIRRFVRERAASSHFLRRASPRFFFGDDGPRRMGRWRVREDPRRCSDRAATTCCSPSLVQARHGRTTEWH